MAWLSGMYVKDAISSCFIEDSKYPKRPYGQEDEEDEAEQMTDAERFGAWAEAFNKEKFKDN